jgi:hypothetical protein
MQVIQIILQSRHAMPVVGERSNAYLRDLASNAELPAWSAEHLYNARERDARARQPTF